MTAHQERTRRSPDRPDRPMAGLVQSWRFAGRRTDWAEVIGHDRAIRYLRVIAEMLRRPPEDLAALRVRLGRGVVIAGPPGVGKTVLARAFASEVEADVVAPPTSSLDAERIIELYAHLSLEMGRTGRRTVVVLDEAEAIIGNGIAQEADEAALSALCEALDGVSRPEASPVTVALTTAPAYALSSAATRPGRLAPRLECSLPTRAERLALLERAVAGLAVDGRLDLDTIADRTGGWSGAGLAIAVEEACTRSLPDHTDALRQDLLQDVIAEGYVVADETRVREPGFVDAVHEAGHALMARLLFGADAVVAVELNRHELGGQTQLADAIERGQPTLERELRLVRVALAGAAAERIVFGEAGMTTGAARDREAATTHLVAWHQIVTPYSLAQLEEGTASDRGSERMRAGLHVAIEARANALLAEVLATLGGRAAALVRIAREVLAAPETSLTGEELRKLLTDLDADG